MASLSYKGEEREFPTLGLTVTSGDVIDVPDDVAENLLAQEIGFTAAKPTSKAKDGDSK